MDASLAWLAVAAITSAVGLLASYRDVRERAVSDRLTAILFVAVLAIKTAFLRDTLRESAVFAAAALTALLLGHLAGLVGSADVLLGSALIFAVGGLVDSYAVLLLVITGCALWVCLSRLHAATARRTLRRALGGFRNKYLVALLAVCVVYWVVLARSLVPAAGAEFLPSAALVPLALMILALILERAVEQELPLGRIDDTYRLCETIVVTKGGSVERLPKTGIAVLRRSSTTISGTVDAQKKDALRRLVRRGRLTDKFRVSRGEAMVPGLVLGVLLVFAYALLA